MGLDTHLIDDPTYFLVDKAGELVGCGGCSRLAGANAKEIVMIKAGKSDSSGPGRYIALFLYFWVFYLFFNNLIRSDPCPMLSFHGKISIFGT